MKNLPNTFLVGCQKTASTWLYQCLQEHPQVFVPQKDAIHYFEINYYKGLEWYKQWFKDVESQEVILDPTPSYIRCYQAPRRIAKFNSSSKLIFSLRNPIERAFSHYWHEKKKSKIAFTFEEAINYGGVGNYDLYNDWIFTGFYYEHIQRFLRYFPREQMIFLLYDDLVADPKNYLEKLFSFLGVEEGFEPSVLHQKINKAKKKIVRKNPESDNNQNSFKKILRKVTKFGRSSTPGTTNLEVTKSEYEIGIKPETRETLNKIYCSENKRLSNFLERDLSHWQ